MSSKTLINVYYDAQCPLCRQERRRYERWSGRHAKDIGWLDVSEHEQTLRAKGVDPAVALRSLHYRNCARSINRRYRRLPLLMKRIPLLVPVAWLIGLPGIKPALRTLYDVWVKRRLKKQGRWPL